MKASRALCVLAILLAVAADLLGSGLVGIYGIVEKVIFEPNERSPERIQIWGAFAFVDGGVGQTATISRPQRGYLYFTLPPGGDQARAAARSDLPRHDRGAAAAAARPGGRGRR